MVHSCILCACVRVCVCVCVRVCACVRVRQALYKNLLTVHKGDGGKLSIGSVVVRVDSLSCDTPLFPNDSPHSRCYLVIDNAKRTVTVFYNAFINFW